MTIPGTYKASLRIRHPSIDPSEISQRLKLSARSSWKRGEQKQTPKGRPLSGIRDYSYWGALLPIYDASNIASLLVRVLDMLARHKKFLGRIVSSGGRVSLYVTGSGQRLAEVFDLVVLRTLADLGCELEIEFFAESSN